jgi:AcrR family transcriptional regulator
MRRDALEKITKGALSVFAEYGYYGATMKKITDASVLSYGLVYHYFSSKEQVFSYLVNDALERSQIIFDDTLNGTGTAWEKLQSLSASLLVKSLTGDSALYFHVMLQALTQVKNMPELKEKIDQSTGTLYMQLIPIIIEAQHSGDVIPGDPVNLATAYLSLVQGLAIFHFQDETITKKITPDILLNVLKK